MAGIGCPTHDELTNYALGKIGDADAEAISRHLETCESCNALLTDTEGAADRLIDLCRQPAPLDRYSQEASCRDAITRAIALGGGFADATDATPPDTVAAPAEEEEPVLGQMGDYKLVEELSHGGMGTVYRAVHVRLEREVALKVLPRGRNTDQKAVARFEREMAAVGKLDHPNIVRATDAGEVEGVQYLAMELIDGFDLTELVDYLGPLGVANSCEVTRQTAIGLQCAYEQGLVHRDIKPSNVMVTGGGVAKVLDLGLARFHIDKQSNIELTTAGQPMGTADYMAPEQVADTHSVDIRADIYSLGCTFYKILAGQPPFGGVQYSSSFDKMMAHRKETPPLIQDFRPDLPKKLVAVLEQMLAKDPDERFQTPSDLAESLYPLCAGANLPEMITKCWDAAEAAPTPAPAVDEATPDGNEAAPGSGSSITTPRRKRRGPGLGSTGGSATHSGSRSQYSNFYVMPPPQKSQWKLWAVISVLSCLLVGILGAWIASMWFGTDDVADMRLINNGQWRVPVDLEAVAVPAIVSLSPATPNRPIVRGQLGEAALVPQPAKIDGLMSWTLETVGHRAAILAAALSPDAKSLATGSEDGAIRVWEVNDRSLEAILVKPSRSGAVRALAWSPAGPYLAAVYQSERLLIWDTQRGVVLRDLEALSRNQGSLVWSPDGGLLAYVGAVSGEQNRNAVFLWDAKAEKLLAPLAGHEGSVDVVAFSPDGAKIAAGGSDATIRVWEIGSAVALPTIQTQDSVSALAWSPCATMLASGCGGGQASHGVVIWDIAHGEELGKLPAHPGGDRFLAWLAETPVLLGVGGGLDGKARLYDMTRGSVGQETDTGPSVLCRAGTTQRFALVGQDGSLQICEGATLGHITDKLPSHPGIPAALAFAPDGQTIASGGNDETIRFFETDTGKMLQHLGARGAIRSLVYSPGTEDSMLAVTTESWNEATQRTEVATEVLDVASGDLLWKFELSSSERIDDLAWAPNGESIATAGDEWRIWHGTTGQFEIGFPRAAESLTWAPDSQAVALGSKPSIELLDAGGGSDLFSCPSPADRRRVMAWSALSGLLAATSGDAQGPEILLLAADSGEPKQRLSASSHRGPVLALGWQAEGKTLLSASATETCVWDAESGKRTNTLAQGARAFSADGTLAAAEGASVVRLWQVADGELLRTVLSLSDHRYAVISPEGHYSGSPGLRNQFVYLVQTDSGQQTFDPKQFTEKFDWENDPKQVGTTAE